MKVIVTAVFHPVPGRSAELASAMRAGIEAVHEEPGCELYAIHDAEDGTITMIEKWASQADFDAHATGSAAATLRASIEGLTSAPLDVTVMTPIPMGDSERGAL
jgi:quinol monooxygenase YgiN